MMTPRDLISDLRSRINPAYSNQRGTESYERKLCADALEAQADEIDNLWSACNSLVRWKAEIDERRILLNLTFPDDYDNSPKYAVQSLLDALAQLREGKQ